MKYLNTSRPRNKTLIAIVVLIASAVKFADIAQNHKLLTTKQYYGHDESERDVDNPFSSSSSPSLSSLPIDQSKEIVSKVQQQHQNQKLKIGLNCLSVNQDMENILNSTRRIFIAMPAKAAGSTMGIFVGKYCMKGFNLGEDKRNKNYFADSKRVEYIKKHNDIFPPVLSSHVSLPKTIINLVRNDLNDDTLLIYMHRPEIDRLLSAIKHVADHLCKKIQIYDRVMDRIHYNSDTGGCIVEETALFDLVEQRTLEIRLNLQSSIGCSFYDEIVKHSTKNMVIAHYKQADKLMEAIAKQHCPKVIDQLPLRVNVGSDKEGDIYVQLESDKSKYVSITDWVEKKKHVLQLKHDWIGDYECQGKMRQIEEKMFSSVGTCIDELVQLVPAVKKC